MHPASLHEQGYKTTCEHHIFLNFSGCKVLTSKHGGGRVLIWLPEYRKCSRNDIYRWHYEWNFVKTNTDIKIFKLTVLLSALATTL